jgi:hypothetical protein
VLGKLQKVKIRPIDIDDEASLEELRTRPPLDRYFFQRPPVTLPRLIERDYADPFFWHWCRRRLEQAGFEHEETQFGYLIVDVELVPQSPDVPTLSFPFMINSTFSFEGLRFAGPFVAGHQAGLSMIQSCLEKRYARYCLPPLHSGVFDSRWQTYVISHSIRGIIDSGAVDGLVAALPNRGRQAGTYAASPIARLLVGGMLTDAVEPDTPGTRERSATAAEFNCLNGRPFQLTKYLFTLSNIDPPEFFDDFVYYSFLNDTLHDRLLREPRFLRLLDMIRRLGPTYKCEHRERSEGVLFDPVPNLEIMKTLIEFCAGWQRA